MGKCPKSCWRKFISGRKYLNERTINFDKTLLKNFYLNKGFYDVEINASFARLINEQEFEAITLAVQNLISQNPMHVDDIIMAIVEFREDKMISVLQFLSDNGQIAMNDEQKLYWIY